MDTFELNAKCVKCGANGDHNARYVPYHVHDPNSNTIERTCERCGYIWYEKPIDRKDDNGNQKQK
jgi:predicted nucleic-acid-binding Zn-ribbon protein